MSDFDDLIRVIEQEAPAEGPKAVAGLEALRRYFASKRPLSEDDADALLAEARERTTSENRTSLDEVLKQYGVTREELRARQAEERWTAFRAAENARGADPPVPSLDELVDAAEAYGDDAPREPGR